MGLSSVLSTAVTGLNASEATIDVVGNNIANSNTVGFKSSNVIFATQFLQTLSLGSAPADTNGGTNPRQIGLGVQVAGSNPNFTQGTIQLSGSDKDFAIQGDGFFIIQGQQGEQLYTRNGQFQLNSQNELVTTTGERVLGYGIDDNFQVQETSLSTLSIPLGNALVAQATTEVTLAGNLAPTGDVADVSEIIQSGILGDGSRTAPSAGPDAALAEAPTSTLAGVGAVGGALDSSATYQYRVVFVDNAGTESLPASTTLNLNTAAGENQINLSNIPQPIGTGYNQVRLYRTDGAGSTFKLLTTLGTGTLTFNDTIADGALGATLNTDSLTGEYRYYVTFTDTLGGGLVTPLGTESRPVPATASPNVSDGRIQLTDLPTDGSWLGRRIYRNRVGFPNDFRLIAEISNMTAGIDFTDNIQDSAITGNKELDQDGPRITTNTLLTDVLRRQSDGSYENMFEVGTLDFEAHKGIGTAKPNVADKSFEITSTSTMQDLMNFLDESLGIVANSPSDDSSPPVDSVTGLSPGISLTDGRIRIVANTGNYNAVQINNSDLSQATLGNRDLGFSSSQSAVGAGAVTTFRVFDSLGVALDVRLTVALESRDNSQTVYRWYADASDNSPPSGSEINVGTGLVRFDGSGRLIAGSFSDNRTVSVEREGIPSISPLNFTLDFASMTGLATTSNTLSAPRVDGFPPGQLTSFIVGEDGRIKGVFDNGASRDLGQMRLARFANPNGLEQRGQNAYAPGVNSGLPVEGSPGEQGIGTLIAGAQELSNTDIGKNLIDLILASTQYRGNTRVITAAQQLLDELLNLRR